eukprot:TRINITY_DN18351_c0_g1_i2.p1 TRINITY_DN18351_c0_g1~~TRINITY_DN18351_c0_g1_i2.p1  ORF type:complete len:209 (+),score=36.97 TRINITY_DN18351_c0_g1_i2:53-679(+)
MFKAIPSAMSSPAACCSSALASGWQGAGSTAARHSSSRSVHFSRSARCLGAMLLAVAIASPILQLVFTHGPAAGGSERHASLQALQPARFRSRQLDVSVHAKEGESEEEAMQAMAEMRAKARQEQTAEILREAEEERQYREGLKVRFAIIFSFVIAGLVLVKVRPELNTTICMYSRADEVRMGANLGRPVNNPGCLTSDEWFNRLLNG